MNFNYGISNPAFNISAVNNIAGTGGNTTLYKTATRNDFTNRIKSGGSIINITLKGIIPDLVSGYYKNYQVDFIHLMDNIDVWPYNTCFFSVSKKPRTSDPKILGGLAAKIYSIEPKDCFPFVYYSGSNNGMNNLFGPSKTNKVIRQLPGKGRNSPMFEYTDKNPESGWKFAFYVLESKKSYIVTNEPILGGTICYIPTSSKEEAEKLKLFVENNHVFSQYVKRMKLKGHAFGLRHVKRFDLNQIVTGKEIPIEWAITEEDLSPPIKFENDISEDRDRVKALGEVFTPTSLVDYVLDTIVKFHPDIFDIDNTFIDSMCGDGQFLVGLKNRGVDPSNLYGIDLTEKNCYLARTRTNSSNIICANSFDNIFMEPQVSHLRSSKVIKKPTLILDSRLFEEKE
jgi:hypothetical protein